MARRSTTEGPVRGAVARTAVALRGALGRRDGRAVLVGTTVLYLLTYLWAIGHLAPGLGGFEVAVVDRPLATLFHPASGPFSFTPISRVTIGPVTYLLALNTLLGALVAILVGSNAALTYLAWRRPSACGYARSSAGAFAAVPAILSGTACCAPVVLLALGIQASSLVLSVFQFLLPLSIVLLLASLLLIGSGARPRRTTES